MATFKNSVIAINEEYLVDKLISDTNSICREERQYALYLYNALFWFHKLKIDNKEIEENSKMASIVKTLFNIQNCADLVIDNVFYEVTFMRDLHEYNKRKFFLANDMITEDNLYKYVEPKVRDYIEGSEDLDNSFNWKLFCYLEKNAEKLYRPEVLDKNVNPTEQELKEYFDDVRKILELKGEGSIKPSKEYHLGYWQKFASENNVVKQDIRSMMNAKPDIAVIYRKSGDDKRYLLFVECKFESGMSKDGIRPQTHIQYMIADFLCSRWADGNEKVKISGKEFGCEISPIMKNQSLKVAFYRNYPGSNEDSNDKDSRKISIEDLIEVNNTIFGATK